jgi:hypothetical protein
LGYQFNHVEAYGRHGARRKNSSARAPSLFGICDEMIREPHACPHVADPQPPEVIYGMHPREAFRLAADRADRAVDAVERRLKRDALCVLAGVASWPVPTAEAVGEPGAWRRYLEWRNRTVAWLRLQWGDLLTSVVEHLDEPYPHVHYVVVPELDPDRRLRIQSVHAGHRAKAECRAAGGTPREQSKAYRRSMKLFQDSYHAHVGAPCGLTRIGPRRQRLTRRQWSDQQRQAEAQARAHAQRMSAIKIEARERVLAAEAAARSEVEEAIKCSHQGFATLTKEANARIARLKECRTMLRNQLSEREAIIASQSEQLEAMRVLLAEHGIDTGWKA